MKKYKLTLTSTVETEDLDLVKRIVKDMRFGDRQNVDGILNKGDVLIEETRGSGRVAITYLKIETMNGSKKGG